MKAEDFLPASESDRRRHVVRPSDQVPMTELVKGSNSHLVFGENALLSFLTMKAGSVFELHSHPQEQIMIVIEGYCDEIIGDRMFRVNEGDVIRLPPNVPHGAFIRDVDCKAIDVFAPVREDYRRRYLSQHPGTKCQFV